MSTTRVSASSNLSIPGIPGRAVKANSTFAEFAFIGGVAALGVLSIGAGFVTSKIPLIVLRALSGIGGSQLRAITSI